MPDLPEYQEHGEFFSRELNIIGKKVNHLECYPLKDKSLIYCHDISHWEKALLKTPEKSISVIVTANEYYDTEKWQRINQFPSIKCVFLQYFPKPRGVNPPWIINHIKSDLKVTLDRKFWGTLNSARTSYKKVRKFKFQVPVHSFPLGYTDRFVRELEKLGLLHGENQSLINDLRTPSIIARDGVSFYGQRGTWYRRRMVENLSRLAGAKTYGYASFGGFSTLSDKTDYSRSILESRFVISPPGNVSSQSFRYYEIVCLGAIPIIEEISIQDWNRHDYWPANVPWKNKSYSQIWKSLTKLNDIELEQLSLDLRHKLSSELAILRKTLELAVTHDE